MGALVQTKAWLSNKGRVCRAAIAGFVEITSNSS